MDLVLEVAAGTLEFSHKAAHFAGDFRQAARPEQHQCYQHEESDFCETEVRHRTCTTIIQRNCCFLCFHFYKNQVFLVLKTLAFPSVLPGLWNRPAPSPRKRLALDCKAF